MLVQTLEYVTEKNKAIDLGGGALNDTKFLLDQGFDVTVVDKSPIVEQEAEKIENQKLHAITAGFEDFDFFENEYDLVSAMFSLPFTNPEHFDSVFNKIKDTLKTDGIFCGQFFGIRDDWSNNPEMTFHTKEQVENMIEDLELISLKEEEKDDKTAKGNIKHWHIFYVIARKK